VVAKVVIFRILSFTATLLAARVWFGDWHTSAFAVFLVFYCTAIHYVFERVWARCGGSRA